MKRLKVRLSDASVNDIMEQADWYEQRSSVTLAKRWDSAVTAAFLRIIANPHSGSPCTSTRVNSRPSGGSTGLCRPAR